MIGPVKAKMDASRRAMDIARQIGQVRGTLIFSVLSFVNSHFMLPGVASYTPVE